MSHREEAARVIEDLDLDVSKYLRAKERPIGAPAIKGLEQGELFFKSLHRQAKVDVEFLPTATGSVVYLGEGLAGSIKIRVEGPDSIVYIGNKCRLKGLSLTTREPGGAVYVGNEVTTAGTNMWSVGGNAGGANPTLIIGDDCMFSGDVIVRTTDAHPVYDFATMQQVNTPKRSILLHPHVWIGQRTAILKDVTIGACSIVATGSIVSRDVPALSVVAGVPASVLKSAEGRFWARNDSPAAVSRAKAFYERFRAA